MSLIPKIKVSKYPLNNPKRVEFGWAPILGIQFTGRGDEFDEGEGFGVGIGIGLIDIWFGWPKKQENLCSKECGNGFHVSAA